MNGVLAEWKQKRAFDLLEDVEHMFGADALAGPSYAEIWSRTTVGFFGTPLRNKVGHRIWEACDISSSCTVNNLISAYCDSSYNSLRYREIRNYPNRMGGKFKKEEMTNE